MLKDYYSILQISPKAEQAAIDAAYLRLAQKYHPSRNRSAEAFERLKQVNEAWEVLSDRSRRAKYDRAWKREHPREQLDKSLGARFAQHRARTDLVSNQTIDSLTRPKGEHKPRRWIGFALLLFLLVSALGIALPQFNQGQYSQSAISSGILIPSPTFTFAPSSTATATRTATPTEVCPHGCVSQELGCVIKAQVQPSDRQGFYYLPGDPDYDGIVITAGTTDRWFCTEADALLNGWTHHKIIKTPTLTPTPTLPAKVTPLSQRLLNVCFPLANIRSGPASDYPVVKQAQLNSSWTVIGTVKDWYYLGIGDDGKDIYIHQSMLCDNAGTPRPIATAVVPVRVNPTATPTPASVGFKYAPPRLLRPGNGATYKCTQDLQLVWEMADPSLQLQENEWFVVETTQLDHQRLIPLEPTRDAQLVKQARRVGGDCEAPWWPSHGLYQWHVRIVSGDYSTHAISKFLSDWSDNYLINYS